MYVCYENLREIEREKQRLREREYESLINAQFQIVGTQLSIYIAYNSGSIAT